MERDFEIEYPAMVEQAYKMILSEGEQTTRQEVYKVLLDKGVIDEAGNPTLLAEQLGLVGEVNPSNKINTFKSEYPGFAILPDEYFMIDDKTGKVMVKASGVLLVAENELRDQDISNHRRKELEKRVALLKRSLGQ